MSRRQGIGGEGLKAEMGTYRVLQKGRVGVQSEMGEGILGCVWWAIETSHRGDGQGRVESFTQD